MACRPQPYRLDPPTNWETLPPIITNADEMFAMLFEDLATLCAEVEALQAAIASLTGTSSTTTIITDAAAVPGGGYGFDGEDGMSIVGAPGPAGAQGPPGIPWPGADGEDGMTVILGP